MPRSSKQKKSSLGHIPTGRWEFDHSVSAVFSDMLERSIPQYEVMRATVLSLGTALVPAASTILDLGCSVGDGLAPFVATLGTRNNYAGIDASEPMLASARERFRREMATGLVKISSFDLRDGYPEVDAGLTLCILTLQFTPIEHRQRILQQAFEHTKTGGAIILVEKVLGSSAAINKIMTDIYYELKISAGYSADEVKRKRLSLEGVLVPVTEKWNEDLLREAGFRNVDCFWRWMNFAGWVAVKA